MQNFLNFFYLLKVQIISAQWLGTLNNVYIEVEIYGIPSDTIRKEFRTKMQKGPNPTWGINSETFTIRKVISPHMALLRLAVYEENSNKVIYFTQILERFLQDKSLSDKS